MASNKLQRVNEDIQRVLASLFRDIKDPRINQGMISITSVVTTSDLKQAKVYLSVFGINSEKDFLRGLKSASGYLRSELGRALSLRNTPELLFELDNSIERGARINTILTGLDISDDSDIEDDDSDVDDFIEEDDEDE
jgi:ribosome-binding factor A